MLVVDADDAIAMVIGPLDAAELRADLDGRRTTTTSTDSPLSRLLSTLVEDVALEDARRRTLAPPGEARAHDPPRAESRCDRRRATDRPRAAAPLPRARRPRGAEQLIEQYLPLVRSLARRYSYRGEQLEDLVQVGCHRPDQGDRPLRHRPRRRADDVRDAEHHRRDQAALPRQGLVDPRAARPPGAQRPALAAASSELTVAARALARRSPSSRRPPGVTEEEVLEALECGQAYTTLSLSAPWRGRRATASSTRSSRSGRARARVRGQRGPRRARPGLRGARRARAPHPAPALLRGPDPVADRAAGRDLADARLAADPPLAREDARRDRDRGRASARLREPSSAA